jgi:hypothetical protein
MTCLNFLRFLMIVSAGCALWFLRIAWVAWREPNYWRGEDE